MDQLKDGQRALPPLGMSPGEFRRAGREVIDFIADYLENAEKYPVLSRAEPGSIYQAMTERALGPADGPTEWRRIWDEALRTIEPGLTHWQSPNFFGFFPANSSYPSILADLLSTGLGVQGMLWATSPACTEVEMRVLDWIAELLGLPSAFQTGGAGGAAQPGGGVIQGTASEATLVSLLAARHRARRQESGVTDRRLVLYASEQAHSSIVKAAMIAGLAAHAEDREQVRLIGTDDDLAMDPARLSAAMDEDASAGRCPFYVAATLGTTSSTAFDPLDRIAEPVCRHNAWLHADAAHAGAALLCPEFRWISRGLEAADSFCFNPHKWLLTNFDCDLLWTRDRESLVGALRVTPEYFRNSASAGGAVIDYRDWQIPLGRRFRALKLWFVLRAFGVAGLREHIREHVRLAGLFETLVRADPRFEVMAPRRLNLVCFRLRSGPDDAPNRALLDRVNGTGRAYLTHTVLRGRYVLRMCIGATRTAEEHVRAAWALIQGQADECTGRG